MFRPNTTCKLYRKKPGRSLYGKKTGYQAPVTQMCGLVKRDLIADKTSVRTDTSGTRGSAKEMVADVRVLFPASTKLSIGDVCVFEDVGMTVEIVSIFPRRHVFGHLDHLQCDAVINTDFEE